MTSSSFIRTLCRTKDTFLRPKTSLLQPLFHRQVLTPSCCALNTSSDSNHPPCRSRHPPRPPTSGPSELPTLDASPFLDSTLYIKKSSKASQTIGGIEATKRLLSGQNQVRSWIWRRKDEICRHGIHGKIGGREKGVEFGLVGHGVPYQCLQDHVDTAWELLNDLEHANVTRDISSEEKEVVECEFYNGNGWLDFDWIKFHTRDGSSHGIYADSAPIEINSHHVKLYLTVMRRMSNAFGTILLAGKDNSGSTCDTQINPDRYWKKDIPTPMQNWTATVKRGFVYPPSVTGAFSQYDVTSGWTGPPIVELMPGNLLDKVITLPSLVRVTVQGIPTVFWDENNDEDSEQGKLTSRNDMVPVSLVFEACFEQPQEIIERKDE